MGGYYPTPSVFSAFLFRLQPMTCATGQEQMLEKIMTEDVKIRKEEKVNLSHVGR